MWHLTNGVFSVAKRQLALFRSSKPLARPYTPVTGVPRLFTTDRLPQSPSYVPTTAGAVGMYSDNAVEQYSQAYMPTAKKYTKSFTIYKTKGALAFSVIPPSYETRDDGSKLLDRYGALLLEFALPKPGMERQYDWENKENFALAVHELGEIFADKQTPHHFTHDPSKIAKVGYIPTGIKVLDIAPPKQTDSKPCYYFNFKRYTSGQNYIEKQISVSVLPGEFYVFQRIADYCIPYLLGIQDKFANQIPVHFM